MADFLNPNTGEAIPGGQGGVNAYTTHGTGNLDAPAQSLSDTYTALMNDPTHSHATVLAFQVAWNAAGREPRLVEDGLWGIHTQQALDGMVPNAPAPATPASPNNAPLPPPATPYVPPPMPTPPAAQAPVPAAPQNAPQVQAGQGWLAVGILAGILGIGWLTSKKRAAGQ